MKNLPYSETLLIVFFLFLNGFKLISQSCNCQLTIGSQSSSGISKWSQSPWQNGTYVDKLICVQGSLEMDVSRNFLNCFFYMDADSKIFVSNFATFKSLSSKFIKCSNTMWDGIEVVNGSIDFFGNKISDAKIGINVLSGQVIKLLSGNTFDRCNIGLKTNNVVPLRELVNNNFLANGPLLSPYTGAKPEYGMYLDNSKIRVRGGNYLGLKNGIYSHYNNIFTGSHTLKIDGITMNDIERFGAECYAGASFKVINSLFRKIGNTAIRSPYTDGEFNENFIFNSTIGIEAFAYNLFFKANHNIMDSINNTGIMSHNSDPIEELIIKNNEIKMGQNFGPYTALNGINCNRNNPLIPGVIENNKIWIPYSATNLSNGIFLSHSKNMKIINNPEINIIPLANTLDNRVGITIRNTNSQIEVSNNNIKGDRLKNPSIGIRQLQNNSDIMYCCNTLEDLNIGMELVGVNNNTSVRGEMFVGPYSTNALFFNQCITGLIQELPANTWNGFAPVDARFVGPAIEALTNPFVTSSNTLPFYPDNPIDAPTPLWFRNLGQGQESHCVANPSCIVNGQNQYDCNEYISDSLILFQGYDGGYGDGQTWQSRKLLIQSFIRNPLLGANCTSVQNFKTKYQNSSLWHLAQVRVMIDDLFQPTPALVSQLSTLYQTLQTSVNQIQLADDHLIDHPEDSSIWEPVIVTNIDILNSTYSLLHSLIFDFRNQRLSTIPSILSFINSINPTHLREIHDKFVSELELQYIQNQYQSNFSSSQIAALQTIADLCVHEYGDPVVRAQSLLSFGSPNTFFLSENCNISIPIASKSNDDFSDISVNVYSNDVSSFILLEGSRNIAEYKINLTDIYGREIPTSINQMDERRYQMDTKLLKGIYLINVFHDNKLIKSTKLILAR